MFAKNEQKVIVAVIACLFALSGILMTWLPPLQALRMVFGAVFLLFMPGFLIAEVAFPRSAVQELKKLDWIERITLSVSLSIAVVPLIVYFLNKAGIAITARNIFLEVLGLIVVAIAAQWIQRLWISRSLRSISKIIII